MSSVPVTAAPFPLEVLCTVNPSLDLLAAFPTPQLLVTSKAQSATETTSFHSNDKEGEKTIIDTISDSAPTLFASSSYEQLHRAISRDGNNHRGSLKTGTASSALSPLAQRIHGRLSELEGGLHANGVQNVRGHGAHSRPSLWERPLHQQMTLRPRAAVPAHDTKPQKPICVNGDPLQKKNTAKKEPVPRGGDLKVETCFDSDLSDIINKSSTDTKSLDSLLGMLSSSAQPFKNIEKSTLVAFVSSLVQQPVPIHRTKRDNGLESAVPVGLIEKAIACCSCISHPSFDVSLLSEGLIDRLITILAVVLCSVTGRGASFSGKRRGSSTELQCLRVMFRCFSLLLTDRRLDTCSSGDLIRLEGLCFQSLFVSSSNREKQEAVTYATYVMSHALQLYCCLWNRLRHQRDTIAQQFFQQLPLTENLILRLHQLSSGEMAMALTVAVVTAAQSSDISTDIVRWGDAERLNQQCRMWAALFTQHFVLKERGKGDRDLVSTAVLQFCEDLAHMLGLPEYPAADLLLQSLLASLAQCSSMSTASTNNPKRQADNATPLPLFVDAVFRVSRIAFSSSMQKLLEESVPPISQLLSQAQLEQWHQLTCLDKASKGLRKGNIRRKVDESGDTVATGEDRRAVLYMALSPRANGPSADAGDVSFYTRAAHVFTWALHEHDFSELTLDRLVRSRHTVEGGPAVDWSMLRVCSTQLCAEQEKSILNVAAREWFLSLLLSVFQIEDSDNKVVGLELAQRKVLTHIAELLVMHPALLEKICPIVRRCVQSDASRVREGTVSLLLTLVSSVCRGDRRGGYHTNPGVPDMITDILSILLHLLNDRSTAVVTRSIAALDTILTEQPYSQVFEQMAAVESSLTFIQMKLLTMVAPHNGFGEVPDPRHVEALQRLFTRRWVKQNPSDFGQHHTHVRVATELLRLARSEVKYPFEVSESMHLVTLLCGMYRAAAAASPGKAGRGGTKHKASMELEELSGVMSGVAKVLWEEWQRLTPAPGAAAPLATIHILSMACSEWVHPVIEALEQAIMQQQTATPTTTGGSEAMGVTLLHSCRIMHTVLSAPRPPPILLDPLVCALSSLLSRYVGPYQQQILLSAAGALTATITCGVGKLSKQVNARYFVMCYSLMNTYYVRLVSLSSSLRTDPQSVAYTLRFLFLLSEFLRLYPGWKFHHQELVDLSATAPSFSATGGAVIPNQLARGDGICANVYALLEVVLRECPDMARMKIMVMALRVMGSLCMLQPTVYLHLCEPYVRSAIHSSSDAQQQQQGLMFIRDFLRDEDARIEKAASLDGRVAPTDLSSSSARGAPRKASGSRRPLELRVPVEVQVEEQNSGMATWLLQQLCDPVILLCGCRMLAVRELALEVLQLCQSGGLLPPSKYMVGLIVLCADPQSSAVRKAAVACVAEHDDRHHDIIATSAADGIVRAFDLHKACGIDVVNSATLSNGKHEQVGSGGSEPCVHAPIFKCVSKRQRHAIISSLLRYFHQETRINEWMLQHPPSASADSATSENTELKGAAANPLPFLAHLAVVLAQFPYELEDDIIHLLDGGRMVVDLYGKSCVDLIQAQLTRLQEGGSVDSCSLELSGAVEPTTSTETTLYLWRSLGVLCITYLRAFLGTVYNFQVAKQRRQRRNSRQTTTPLRNGSQHTAFKALCDQLRELIRNMSPLWDEVEEASGTQTSRKIQSTELLLSALNRAMERESMSTVSLYPSGLPTKLSTTDFKSEKRKRPRASYTTPSDGVSGVDSASSEAHSVSDNQNIDYIDSDSESANREASGSSAGDN